MNGYHQNDTLMSSAVQFFGIPLTQSFRLSTDGVTHKYLLGLESK